MTDKQLIDSLHLFKSLIKDGCLWQGDIMSRKFSECLYVPEGLDHQVEHTLNAYPGAFERRGNEIWIY